MNEKELNDEKSFVKVRRIVIRVIFWLLVGILAVIALCFLVFVIVSILAYDAGVRF